MPPMITPIAIAMIRGSPTAGMTGTRRTAQAIVATLNIAGDSAGTKNLCSEFNIPMNAAAIATQVRNGSMMRVRKTVSSSLPGTSA